MDHIDPDSADIYREINEENQAECTAEIARLLRKLKGYQSHFTIALGVLARLINSSQNGDNQFDRSTDTMNAMRRARYTLESRYKKVEKCYFRIMDLTSENEDFET